MRRHLRWIIPAVCVPLAFTVGIIAAVRVEAVPGFATNAGLELAAIALLLLAFLGPVVAAIFTIVGSVAVWRRWRRAHGHLGARGRRAAARQRAFDQAWVAARRLRSQLIAREVPAPIAVWEIVPRPGEVMFFDLEVEYARYHGQAVVYSQVEGRFSGNPAFVIAGLAAVSIGNAVRRTAAELQAQKQWREWQRARIVVTNRRLLCFLGDRWLTFEYSAFENIYAEIDHWTLIGHFGELAVPLLLRGAYVPLISVMTVFLAAGPEALAAHPRLRLLDDPGPVAGLDVRKADDKL